MIKGRIIYEKDIKDYEYNSHNIKLGVYGLFDSNDIKWKYYLISFYNKGFEILLTPDLCKPRAPGIRDGGIDISPWNAASNYKEIFSVEEGVGIIEDFKIKWETGSNDTRGKIRDKKISNILDDEDKTTC